MITLCSTVPAQSKCSINASYYYDNLHPCLFKNKPYEIIQEAISHTCAWVCTHMCICNFQLKITWMTQLLFTDTWYSVEYDTTIGDLTQHWRRQFLSLKEVHSGILKHILK